MIPRGNCPRILSGQEWTKFQNCLFPIQNLLSNLTYSPLLVFEFSSYKILLYYTPVFTSWQSRSGLIPGLGRSPGKGNGNPPAFLPRKSHGQRRLVGYSPVQSLNWIRLFEIPWTTTHQAFLSITNSQSLLKLMSIESVIPSNHLILRHPLLLPPSIFPSIGVFSNESVLPIRWPKYWSFSFSISPSKEYSGLISFRMDWLALLAVQGTLKSLLQHHSSKASIHQHSAFFIGQLSHPYMTHWKNHSFD